jgi:aspartyl-tRNA(Asn)/glutamyl-tRNA(Gln) amidotransferase subunit A
VNAELHDLTLTEVSAGIAAGTFSPVEITDAYLARIDALNERLHAYVYVTADQARADARRAESERREGRSRGPLHGVPLALKDLFDTAGVATTGCSRAFIDRVPTTDAFVVAKLCEAGAVLLGKLTMHELATGTADPDGPFPPARNPWDVDRMPSGSSSGSGTAVAAGLCAGALGSDTGGSIRGPSSWCGIVGHKPTYGLVSRRGVMPLSWSQDHVGPMTRTVEDTAIVLQAIAGYDPADDGSAEVQIPDYRAALREPVAGLTVGVPRSYLDTLSEFHPETIGAFWSAVDDLRGLGVTVVDFDLPYAEHLEVMATGILLSEAYAIHERGFREHLDRYGQPFRDRVIRGALWSAADYAVATRARGRFCRAMGELLTNIDVMALPTSLSPAERFDDETYSHYARPSFTRIFNLTGQPSVSLPCGFTESGLPIGLMLSGRPFEDATVLRLAYAYEQSHNWYRRRPPSRD